MYMNGHSHNPWQYYSNPWFDPWEMIYKQQFDKLYSKKGKDMRPKDLVELAKTLDELKKMGGGDKKPEEKKKDPEKWDTLDYFTCIVGVGGMIIMMGTWAILYEIVKLAEVLHK